MAISPPLIPGEDAFNAFNTLADKLAAKLSSAFGYTPSEAEQYIRTFYDECESSEPQRRKQLRDSDVSEHGAWADDHARFRAADGRRCHGEERRGQRLDLHTVGVRRPRGADADRGLTQAHLAVADFEHLRAMAEGFEQVLIRAGEPGLAFVREQFIEQSRATH